MVDGVIYSYTNSIIVRKIQGEVPGMMESYGGGAGEVRQSMFPQKGSMTPMESL